MVSSNGFGIIFHGIFTICFGLTMVEMNGNGECESQSRALSAGVLETLPHIQNTGV